MPPCHRPMVIATNFSSMFDLLLCSTPQTWSECCWGAGITEWPLMRGRSLLGTLPEAPFAVTDEVPRARGWRARSSVGNEPAERRGQPTGCSLILLHPRPPGEPLRRSGSHPKTPRDLHVPLPQRPGLPHALG